MKKFIEKNWKTIVACIVIMFIGFMFGRWTTKPTVKVKYIKGETITETIYKEQLKPYLVVVPEKPTLPTKPDTVEIPGKPQIVFQKTDTAKIIGNYIRECHYVNTLFDDDTKGKLKVNSVIQYNQLKKMSYEFNPIEKVTTIEKQRVLTPYINASYNTLGYFGAGGGVYYHNVGVSVKYITDFNNKGYEVGIHYKF